MRSHLHKKAIAEAQLNTAIRCYLVDDYIPAVTLAGAAEEIYAAYVHTYQQRTALGMYVKFMRIRGAIETKNALVNRANKIRNEFKHHGSGNSERLWLDVKVAATIAIHRAIENYLRVGGHATSLIRKYYVAARNVG